MSTPPLAAVPPPFTGSLTLAPHPDRKVKLSLVIPCYNEEGTLDACVASVLAIADSTLELELLEENRFGFEPEVVAKIAQLRLRIYEMGISYRGRTYAEGKKVGMKDGWRALYCILKYNLHKVPLAIQFLFYLFIGGFSAIVNMLLFLGLLAGGLGVTASTSTAFFLAAFVNYYLSIKLLFRHKARWQSVTEMALFLAVVIGVGIVDLFCTRGFLAAGMAPWAAKALSTAIGLVLNFAGRRFIVFPEKPNPDWKPQGRTEMPD